MEVGTTVQEVLGPCNQHEWRITNGFGAGRNPFGRQSRIINRLIVAPSCVLNTTTSEPRVD